MDIELIAWLGFSQGLFAAVLMKTKAKLSIADKVLTAWLALLAIEFFTCAIDYKLFETPLLSSSFLLFNPAAYLYIKSLLNPKYELRWTGLLHLVPFLFFELGAYILQEPYELKLFLEPDGTLWFRMLFTMASILSWGYYNLWSIVMVIRHRGWLEDEFSTIERGTRLGWILFIVVFYNFYCVVAATMGLVVIVFKTGYYVPHAYNYSTLLLLVYILGFYGLKQSPVFSTLWGNLERFKREHGPLKGSEEKAQTLSLSDKRRADIRQRLIKHFDETKPYLNAELSMSTLSEQLNIPKHHITEVLNSDMGKNFFRFANEYRVNAVKDMLGDKKNLYSIEAIGYECGFNSKSAFFTVFKRITGQTPLQYKQSMGL